MDLRESQEEGRRSCCKRCWKSNKEGWWKATRGVLPQKPGQEKSDQGYQIRQEGQRGHRDSRVSQKEVIWDLGELVRMGRAGARLQWVRGKEINAVVVNRPFKSLRSEREKGVLGEKEKLTCLHWNFTNNVLLISFPFLMYELPILFGVFVLFSDQFCCCFYFEDQKSFQTPWFWQSPINIAQAPTQGNAYK